MAEDKQREKNQTLFEDLCLRARRGSRVYSKFLSPDAAARLKNLAARQGLICLPLGGGQDAERVLCAVYQEEWQQPADDETPLCVLAIRFDERFGEIGHRDVLGAILGLGIERECVGDIRIEPGCAYAAVYAPMASYICNNLDKAGRTSVKAEIASCPLPPPPRGKMQRVNVPSLRLDACLQQTLHVPRGHAQELIRAGRVLRNWEEELRPDAQLQMGDMVSVRGTGRFRVLEIAGESRKNRLFIDVETFLK